MKALVITRHGGPEVLEVTERAKPHPTGDEILVRVLSAGVNRADLMQREGHYPAPPGSPPDIPGLEYCGVVESVGPHAKSRRAGQRVFGLVGGGAQAEYLTTREALSMLVPDSLDDIAAGGVPEAYITAHDALVVRGRLRRGERVLVHAVGSGVGIAALQLAKANGCHVYGTSRTREKLTHARELGLDVAIDAAATDFGDVAREVDVIIDFIGAPYFERNIAVLRSGGRLVQVSTLGGTSTTLALRALMSKRLSVIGTMLRSRSHEEKVAATRAFEHDVLALFAAASVRVPVDRTFTLEQAADAHRYVADNRNFGKVVFRVAGPAAASGNRN